MKNRFLLWMAMSIALPATSQVGIGTTTPNSMLDVRGALSLNYRSFTGNTTIGNNDNTLVFTGTSNATAALPDATACIGRMYRIKNASTAAITPVLTISTTSGQSIDGISGGWVLDEPNESITILSNGTGWYISDLSSPQPSSNNWAIDGNGVTTERKIGTTSNYSLPFITDNIERMRITGTGRLGIGTCWPATETHISAAGVSTGITQTYVKGMTITANGTYGFGGPGFYLENVDNPAGKRLFKINYTANGGPDGYINFQAVSDNGGANVNANILSVMHSGRVGIGTATFSGSNPEKLLVDAGYTNSNNLIASRGASNLALQNSVQNLNGGEQASANMVARADNATETANLVKMGIHSSAFISNNILGGANNAYLYASGNDFVIGNASANKQLIFFTGGTDAGSEIACMNGSGLQPGGDNKYSLGKNGARWSEVWSANGVIQTSDARLKTDIINLKYGLGELMQLRPVSYRWKDKTGTAKIGLIAQEVQQVIPEVVSGNEENGNLGMNYAELVPLLINSIKELKQEVDDLKKKLEAKKDK